jgi:osmotically-inducible protein OsmY
MKTPAQTLRLSILALATAVALPVGLFANDTDDRIEKNFKDSYTYRTQLKNADVSADAENGVVTLKGDVDYTEQKTLAEDTARGIAGVTSVKNELKVKGDPKESSDDWIALKVRSALLYRRNVSMTSTDVNVLNGNVTLTGTAESAAEKSLAGEYAADIKGVKNVDNRITVVSKADKKADKNHADKNHASADNRDMSDKVDDASITAQVKGSLAISRSASAIRTDVTTRDGVVTLRGEAKNSAEKELAGKIAKDIHGVRDVNNEIVVVNKVAGE